MSDSPAPASADPAAGGPPPSADPFYDPVIAAEESAAGEPAAAEAAEPAAESAEAAPERDPKSMLAELARLREARRREAADLKATREEAERLRQINLRMLESRAEPQQGAKAPEPAPIPDANADPFGHLQARLAQAEEKAAAAQQFTAAQQAEARLRATVQAAEAQFVQQRPDYTEAIQYARPMMERMASAWGMTGAQAAAALAVQALQAGRNPAQAAYDFALSVGWKPGGAPQHQAAPKPSAEAEIAALERGAAASRTVGAARGSGPPQITLETLASASREEFAELSRKYPAQVRRAMGG